MNTPENTPAVHRAPDAQAAWITQYLEVHPGAAPSNIDPSWAEAFARSGPSVEGQVTELYQRVNQLQDRLRALEQAATRSSR